MKLNQSGIRYALAVLVIGTTFNVNTASASATCGRTKEGERLCKWTSQWGSDIPVRVTIGLDQNNTLRWVASQLNDPSRRESGTMSNFTNYVWTFIGSLASDVMMEVPYSNLDLNVVHGPYTLRGGFWVKGIKLHGNGSSDFDVILGGDHTVAIKGNDEDLEGLGRSAGQGVFIIHPNNPADSVNSSRRIIGAGTPTSYSIVGPSLAPSQTKGDNIFLHGGLGNNRLCNLTNISIAYDISPAVIWDPSKPHLSTATGPEECQSVYAIFTSYVLQLR